MLHPLHWKLGTPQGLKKQACNSKEERKFHSKQPRLLVKPRVWLTFKNTQATRISGELLPGYFVLLRSYLFTSTHLSVAELAKAKTWLMKYSQAEMFPDAVETLRKGKQFPLSNSLQPLNPFLGADGLLRVGGRLSQPLKDYHSRHPVILYGSKAYLFIYFASLIFLLKIKLIYFRKKDCVCSSW